MAANFTYGVGGMSVVAVTVQTWSILAHQYTDHVNSCLLNAGFLHSLGR